MATNTELLSKLEDKVSVVESLASELDYTDCSEKEKERLDEVRNTLTNILSDIDGTIDAMETTLSEKEDDRSASEDDSDEEKE